MPARSCWEEKHPDAWPYCKEFGLVRVEVHFCRDARGFHGAPDERDHTEVTGDRQSTGKATGTERHMMEVLKYIAEGGWGAEGGCW